MKDSNIEIFDDARDVLFIIRTQLFEYQCKNDKNSHVVLSFANFSKEVSIALKLVWYTCDIVSFSGLDLETGSYVEIHQNRNHVNYMISCVSPEFSNITENFPLPPVQFEEPDEP